MAEHLAARGFIAVLLDPPGVGESDAPDDGYALTPDVVADLHACAFDRVLAALRAGKSGAPLPALRELVSIGVGHSAGGLVTAVQQARHRSHAALALLGVAGGGLVDQLEASELRYADAPEALHRDLAKLVAARFGDPLPVMQRGSSRRLVRAEMQPAVRDALVAARAPLLALIGFASLVPGAFQRYFAALDVPLLLGVGEHDITGDPRAIPAQFPNCRDLTLYVLPDAGHNHNVAPTRELLWDRIADWIRSLPCAHPAHGGRPAW
jgi:pimeloyl-ACP methyl ester carboxylesterase